MGIHEILDFKHSDTNTKNFQNSSKKGGEWNSVFYISVHILIKKYVFIKSLV